MANESVCVLDLPGDLEDGGQTNGDTEGIKRKCKGGQTGATGFSALIASKQTAAGSRSGGGHMTLMNLGQIQEAWDRILRWYRHEKGKKA